jgi:hypothetical protein
VSRPAGSVVDRWTSCPRRGEAERDRGGDRRLAHAALAEHEHGAGIARGELVDERVEIGRRRVRLGCGTGRGLIGGLTGHEAAQRRHAGQVPGDERHARGRTRAQGGRHRLERLLLMPGEGLGDTVSGKRVGEDTVDDEALIADALGGELRASAGRLAQRSRFRSRDQD